MKCLLCNAVDKTGLINEMCMGCYDMYLDIGKTGKEIDKKRKKIKRIQKKEETTMVFINNQKQLTKFVHNVYCFLFDSMLH